MDERERMLAEGPRVAPEPPPAESGFGFEAPKPVVETPTGRVPPTRRAQLPFLRLIPLAGFALFVLVSAAGYRQYAFLFLAAGIGISMFLRTRARRR